MRTHRVSKRENCFGENLWLTKSLLNTPAASEIGVAENFSVWVWRILQMAKLTFFGVGRLIKFLTLQKRIFCTTSIKSKKMSRRP
jgi:hypothetical protein